MDGRFLALEVPQSLSERASLGSCNGAWWPDDLVPDKGSLMTKLSGYQAATSEICGLCNHSQHSLKTTPLPVRNHSRTVNRATRSTQHKKSTGNQTASSRIANNIDVLPTSTPLCATSS